MVVSFLHLGRMDYADALALQQTVCAWRKERTVGDVVLLVEHPPVLTVGRNAWRNEGRNGGRSHILASDQLLAARGIALYQTNRGGDVTYHGPGQLVGYPILDLHGFAPRLGAVDMVRKLEEVLIRSCADYGVLTGRIAGYTGVWTLPGGTVREKKIAALGIHISRWITSHGFALNVTTDLKDFDLIVPCGISDREVTSMEAEVDPRLYPAPTLERMSDAVVRHFARVFERKVVWVDSVEQLEQNGLPDGRSEDAAEDHGPEQHNRNAEEAGHLA